MFTVELTNQENLTSIYSFSVTVTMNPNLIISKDKGKIKSYIYEPELVIWPDLYFERIDENCVIYFSYH